MLIKHFTTQGLSVNHFKNMLQKSSVATSHIENTFWLLFNWKVKKMNQNFVNYLKIRFVRTATSPNVHFAVNVDFIRPIGLQSQDRRISENQGFYFFKSRKIGNRHTIR